MVDQSDSEPGEGVPQPGESGAGMSGESSAVPDGGAPRWLAPELIRGSIEWARFQATERLDALYADGLAEIPGGADLAYVLGAAHESRFHQAALLEAVAACERLVSWAQAKQAAYLQELGRRRRDYEVMTSEMPAEEDSRADQAEAAEVGARLAITPRAARARLDLADGLYDFPDVHDALKDGLIDARKADVLVQCPPGVGGFDHGRIVATVLPWAPRLTVPALKRRIAKLVIELAPETALVRQREAYADRCVSIEPAGDGMAWLTAYLRADDAIAVRRTLDRLADTGARVEQANRRARLSGESSSTESSGAVGSGAVSGAEDHQWARTLDQLRADAFVSAFERLDTDRDHARASEGSAGRDDAEAPAVRVGAGPLRRRAHRSAINITISADTLAGLDEKPAELAGYGPIPAPLAREIINETQASSAKGRPKGERGSKGETKGGPKLRYLALDDNGQPTATSTIAYRPGQDLSAAVTAQEQYCTFPGCGMPACYTDLDHIESYKPQRAGSGEHQTRAANLQPLCRSHHNLKTRGLWTTCREPDGTLTWTSTRTGHQYRHSGDPPPGAPTVPPPPTPGSSPEPALKTSAGPSPLPPAWSCITGPPAHPTVPTPGLTTPHERAMLGTPQELAPALRERQIPPD